MISSFNKINLLILNDLADPQSILKFYNNFYCSLSLIEKQNKLYNFSSESLNLDLHKSFIKTETENDFSILEDIFVDCTTLLSKNDLKLESQEPEFAIKSKKRKAEFNDDEQEKLLAEFKAILKSRKDKK